MMWGFEVVWLWARWVGWKGRGTRVGYLRWVWEAAVVYEERKE